MLALVLILLILADGRLLPAADAEYVKMTVTYKKVGDLPVRAAVYRPDSEGIRRLEDAGYTHLISLPWLRPDAPAPSLEEKRAAVEAFGETTIARFA